MNVAAKPQKPCRRLIGGEEFEEEEVERPLVTAAQLCIKTVQICLDQFLAAQEVDMTTRYESLLGGRAFFSSIRRSERLDQVDLPLYELRRLRNATASAVRRCQ